MKAKRYWVFLFVVTIATLAQLPASKRVEIDKGDQTLRAYEGKKLVLQCRVSTGKWDRSTPNGTFAAGAKERMHYSSLYHQAPMPFSVHVTGNVFIHGFTYVPPWPDSHGCIRLPLDGGNPAKRFYEWVESGTPIIIKGRWRERPGEGKSGATDRVPSHADHRAMVPVRRGFEKRLGRKSALSTGNTRGRLDNGRADFLPRRAYRCVS